MEIQGLKTSFCNDAILEWQRDQYIHDQRNHFDILSLHKQDRLKHYAMHMAKYAGRVARGAREAKPVERTCVDALLVSLSAANTLHQRLSHTANQSHEVFLYRMTDAAGRMNDACEKMDHLEPFLDQVTRANQDIFKCLLDMAAKGNFDPKTALECRRKEISDLHFYMR